MLRGGKCWAQAGSHGPTEAEAEAPACRGWGGGRGCGRPCYCWQEVAPFFPDGETEAQGGFFVFFFFFGTLPKSLTVSQLLGRVQLTRRGTRSHGPRSPPPLGRQGRAEGPRRPGGGHSAALKGWGGRQVRGGPLLGTGQGQVQYGRAGRGAFW